MIFEDGWYKSTNPNTKTQLVYRIVGGFITMGDTHWHPADLVLSGYLLERVYLIAERTIHENPGATIAELLGMLE